MEWSGGRGHSQMSQAMGLTEDQRFLQRLSTGITYTTAQKLSFTLEYSSNSAAPDASQWSALQGGSPSAYALYRNWTQSAQELTTRMQYALLRELARCPGASPGPERHGPHQWR